METANLGVKETLEVLDFAIGVVDDLAKARGDDGKISVMEYMQVAGGNAPAGFNAVVGADKIDDELKDLDADEIKQLAVKGVALAQAVGRMVMP